MSTEETKHDLFLKRIQVTIAILAGVATLIVGVYNVKKTLFSPTGPGQLSASIRSSDSREPVSGADVELYNTLNALINTAETKGDGAYSRGDLDAGNYVLRVTRSGYEPFVVNTQINSRKTTELEIVLRALPKQQAPVAAAAPVAAPSPIRSALEDAGASWIRKLGKADSDNTNQDKSGGAS